YLPDDSFNEIFMLDPPDDATGDPTLFEALSAKGNKYDQALQRHAAAALLNAASGEVNYLYSFAELKALVMEAYDTGTKAALTALAGELAEQNELEQDPDPNVVAGPGRKTWVDGEPEDWFIVPVDAQLRFTYMVTNPGDVPLDNVMVTDDNATPDDETDDFMAEPVLEDGYNVGDTNQN
ncbi:MAG: hypothetical protein GTO62_19865, partial [Planctomycetales bacterium]|nr:hypothetical protein [Planctomycetales bacterium]